MADTAFLPQSKLAYLIEAERPSSDFKTDVIKGLSERPFELHPKYFYDARGAELFEAICTTPEYYVTSAEKALLEGKADLIADVIGPDANFIEPGSGAAEKIRILLDACETPAEYTLFDISREQLEAVAADLAEDFPDLRVGAVAGDFTRSFPLEEGMFSGSGKRVCFFPGGTLGNFSPEAQISLLNGFKRWLRPGDGILLGVDRIKDTARLDAAYNDTAGYTAAFNLNILHHMQHAIDARLDIDAWEHLSFFNVGRGCIEMHLLATEDTEIAVQGHTFRFDRGDSIKTEESWKFDVPRLKRLASALSLELDAVWSGPNDMFSLVWLKVPEVSS